MAVPEELRPTFPIPAALSREYLEGYLVLPLAVVEGRLKVAAAGEPDPQGLHDLAFPSQAEPSLVHVVEADRAERSRRTVERAGELGWLSAEGFGPAPPTERQL